MKKFWGWLYRFIFLNIIHSGFFCKRIKFDLCEATSPEKLKSFFEAAKIQISLDKKKSQGNFLNTATIIYSNHPTSFDPLMISAIENLSKVKIVSVLVNKIFFPFYKGRIIPVASISTVRILNPIILQTKLASKIENFTTEQAKKINYDVPKIAVQNLAQKTPILIFPPGSVDKWHDGIGFIVDEFIRQQPTKSLNFQPLHVSGTTTMGMLFHGFKLFFGLEKTLSIKITRGKNFDLSVLKKAGLLEIEDKKTRAKAIRNFLEKRYFAEFQGPTL